MPTQHVQSAVHYTTVGTTPMQHAGCSEGMVTIDGSEKLTKVMCAALKEKVKCPQNHMFQIPH